MEFYSKSHISHADNLQYSNMEYFGSISWSIKTPPSEAMHNDEKLSEEQLMRIENTDFHTAYLIIPLSRFYEVTEVMPIGNKLTLHSVINKLYDFYHKPLTEEEVEKVKLFPGDIFKYNSDLVARYTNGEIVCYADIRGDCEHFEGIQRVEGNVYQLRLGS